MRMSRRRLLLTASTLSVLAGAVSLVSADTVALSDADRKPVSFKEARALSDKFVDNAIHLSAKEFGTDYSSNEIRDIKNRIWDKTQVTMLQFYKPLEKE
jgi:hypothetical protein